MGSQEGKMVLRWIETWLDHVDPARLGLALLLGVDFLWTGPLVFLTLARCLTMPCMIGGDCLLAIIISLVWPGRFAPSRRHSGGVLVVAGDGEYPSWRRRRRRHMHLQNDRRQRR
jgi:hypothetical protein